MGMSDTRSRGYLAILMDTIFDECRALRNAGQQEYAHDDANAYANFERLALRMGLSREQVLMVYLEKHIDGIHSYIQGHKSQRESVVGRINDAIVYLCILRGMVENSGAAPKKILDERAAEQSDGTCEWYTDYRYHHGNDPAHEKPPLPPVATPVCAACKHDHGRALNDPNQSCLRHLAPQVPCGCDKSTLFRYEAALSDIEL